MLENLQLPSAQRQRVRLIRFGRSRAGWSQFANGADEMLWRLGL